MGKKLYNVVVVGEPNSGKNTLLTEYAKSKLKNYCSTAKFRNRKIKITLQDNQVVELSLWNTSGIELNKPVIEKMMRTADFILLCYAIDDLETLINVEENWMPFVKSWNKSAPRLLLGNKEHLREDKKTILELSKHDKKPVPKYDGDSLADRIGACGYLECSVLEDLSKVEDVFETVAWICLKHKRKIKCTIL